MKKVSFILIFFLCAGFFVDSKNIVQAEEQQYSEIPTIGNPSPDISSASVTGGQSQNGISAFRVDTGILSYSAGLGVSGKTITYWGTTAATHVADTVGFPSYKFQYWDGYNWQDLSSGPVYAYNNVSCQTGGSYTGTSGRYYRVGASHYVKIGSVVDSISFYYTDYIYIS